MWNADFLLNVTDYFVESIFQLCDGGKEDRFRVVLSLVLMALGHAC